jgi:hypothetical protein
MTPTSDLKEKASKIEREIYSLMGKEVPSLFDTRKWKGKVMELAMGDDAVKVPLFRFIDALPSLKSDARVVGLLKEYFSDVENSPLIFRKGMAAVSGAGLVPSIAGKILRARVASFGRQFIAGEDPQDALDALKTLRKERLAFREEIFGPVLAVMRAHDIDEALEIANSTAQALTGGIYSRSPENVKRAERDFGVGNLYINRKITRALVARQPFGGFGMSDVGSKAGGPDYLVQFMNPRSICENTMRRGFAP